MKRLLITLFALLGNTLTSSSQDLFFIGEKSYPCTETISLKSNSGNASDLNISFAKDSQKGLIAVITETMVEETLSEKLIIYLRDGTVITCNNLEISDYVDNHAKAVYHLTNDQLNKMKISDIHTIRFTLVLKMGFGIPEKENNYTASNMGTSTKSVIADFYNK